MSTTEPPHVTVKRREPNPTYPGYNLVYVDCPFCGREHVHGDGPGHRVAHCGPSGRPNPGYIIDYPETTRPKEIP